MGDESGGSAPTEGYVVPIAGLVAFALTAGLTAGHALSGDLTDAAVPIALGAIALLALQVRSGAPAAETRTRPPTRTGGDSTARSNGAVKRTDRPADATKGSAGRATGLRRTPTGASRQPRTRGRIAHRRRDQNP